MLVILAASPAAPLIPAAIAAPAPAVASPPATPRPPLDAYGNLPDIEDVAISTSGTRTAMVGTFSGKRGVVATDGAGKVLVFALIGEAKVRGIEWAGDEFVLVYYSNTTRLNDGFTAERIEASSALILPADGGQPQTVFANSSRIVNSIEGRYGLRKVDGRWTGFFGGLELKRSNGNIHNRLDEGAGQLINRPVLFAVDLATNQARQAAPSARVNYWRDWVVDANGAVVATLDYSGFGKTWEIFDAQNKVIARGKSPREDIRLIALGPDGKSVIYGDTDENLHWRWYTVPLAGGETGEFLPEVGISSIFTDPLTGRLMGYRETGADGSVRMLDPRHDALIAKIGKAFPKLHVSYVDWTPDLGNVLVHTSGTKDSGTWYKVNVGNLHASAVGYDYMPIGPEWVGPVSRIAYKAADGLAMDGVLTVPPDREARNLPVVVLPHGGPHAHDKVSFDWWAQAFASRGYAVFQPNFRGSTGRGQDFELAGDNEWGRKMQTDISDGLAELVRRGIADPKRACIVGASYGGYAALAGVTLQQGLYRCAVAVAPVSDLWQMYHEDNALSGYSEATWRALKRLLGPTSGYSALSPARNADKADAPILLIHGTDDTRVPIAQSETMADALKDSGKPHEFIRMKGEDHFLSHGETRKAMLNATLGFVERYNPAD